MDESPRDIEPFYSIILYYFHQVLSRYPSKLPSRILHAVTVLVSCCLLVDFRKQQVGDVGDVGEVGFEGAEATSQGLVDDIRVQVPASRRAAIVL